MFVSPHDVDKLYKSHQGFHVLFQPPTAHLHVYYDA